MKIKDRIVEFKRVPAGELQPNPKNWRKHPQAQQDALRGVLAEIGYAGAVLARKTPEGGLMLIDGHLRAETDPQGMIPTLILDVDEEEAAKILATFDPLSAMAEADKSKLDELLREVDTGSPALQQMLEDLAESAGLLTTPEIVEDEVPEPPVEPVTRTGDLWVMGEHRLLCGDSTDGECVDRLFAGGRASLLFTSPPYGQQRDYGAAKEQVQDWDKLMTGVFQHVAAAMEPDGQILVNLGLIHRDGEWIPYWDGWIAWMREQGWRRFGWYVWDQGSGLPGDWNGRLAPSHEFVFHFNRSKVRPEKISACSADNVEIGRKATARRAAGKDVTSMRGSNGVVKSVSSTQRHAFKIPDSVIRISRCATIDMARNSHPATFPIQLAAFALGCWPGLVFEPFSGSGTTLIAAQQLNRRCVAMELDPAYVDVACERYRKLTNIPAILESTRQTFDEVKAERFESLTTTVKNDGHKVQKEKGRKAACR